MPPDAMKADAEAVEPEGTSSAEYEEKIQLLEKHIRKQKNHHGKKHAESQMVISVKDMQIQMLQEKIDKMEKDLILDNNHVLDADVGK